MSISHWEAAQKETSVLDVLKDMHGSVNEWLPELAFGKAHYMTV